MQVKDPHFAMGFTSSVAIFIMSSVTSVRLYNSRWLCFPLRSSSFLAFAGIWRDESLRKMRPTSPLNRTERRNSRRPFWRPPKYR